MRARRGPLTAYFVRAEDSFCRGFSCPLPKRRLTCQGGQQSARQTQTQACQLQGSMSGAQGRDGKTPAPMMS